MDTHLNEESEEDERQRLLLFSSAKVVEYLEPIMSRELLSKFPDNTAFGFDYSQSSIWSPLVPRTYNAATSSSMDLESISPKKLRFGFGMDVGGKGKMSVKKFMGSSTTKKKKKKMMMISSPVFKINLDVVKSKNKMKMKMRASQFSSTPIKNSCFPFAPKGWNKVLKAASKRFKKKKTDPSAHVKLSDYLKIGNI